MKIALFLNVIEIFEFICNFFKVADILLSNNCYTFVV